MTNWSAPRCNTNSCWDDLYPITPSSLFLFLLFHLFLVVVRVVVVLEVIFIERVPLFLLVWIQVHLVFRIQRVAVSVDRDQQPFLQNLLGRVGGQLQVEETGVALGQGLGLYRKST